MSDDPPVDAPRPGEWWQYDESGERKKVADVAKGSPNGSYHQNEWCVHWVGGSYARVEYVLANAQCRELAVEPVKQKSPIEIELGAIEVRARVARKRHRKGEDISGIARDIAQRSEVVSRLVAVRRSQP